MSACYALSNFSAALKRLNKSHSLKKLRANTAITDVLHIDLNLTQTGPNLEKVSYEY